MVIKYHLHVIYCAQMVLNFYNNSSTAKWFKYKVIGGVIKVIIFV